MNVFTCVAAYGSLGATKTQDLPNSSPASVSHSFRDWPKRTSYTNWETIIVRLCIKIL